MNSDDGSIIADSSALISLLIATDSNHKKAIELALLFKNHNKTLIVPPEIYAEMLNILGKKFGHEKAYQCATIIIGFDFCTIVESNEGVRFNALKKFRHLKESISFMDCIVMSFADHFETKNIFGFDRGFELNGYALL